MVLFHETLLTLVIINLMEKDLLFQSLKIKEGIILKPIRV